MRYKFMRFPQGKAKAVTLSYDDGCSDDARLSDVITGYGLKCTFNLNCEDMRDFFFTKEEIEKYFLSRGHEIAVHGAKHKAEGVIRPIDGIKDVLECRVELENKLGIIIRGMAYPDSGINVFSNGAEYDNIKHYLKDLDIAYARTLGGDNNLFNLPQDWYAWMPTAKHTNPDLMKYIDEFVRMNVSDFSITRRAPKLFFIWGHSFEFAMDNNWCLLEEICEKLSGHDDIWYATNMEIYKYVKAYESLEYSADGRIVYNPTLCDIWLDVDEKIYKIPSGKSIYLQ